MTQHIGTTAGQVWHYLNTHGSASVTRIARDTGLDAKTVHRAIGWLAKENKLVFETRGRSEILRLG